MNKQVWIHYTKEAEGWWAESKDLPGWSAAGQTFEEVKALAITGVYYVVGGYPIIIEDGAPAESFKAVGNNEAAKVKQDLETTGALIPENAAA